MRLIDADALNERMYHDAFEADSDMQKWDSGCWIRYKMFERAIEDAPTIESERKKGKWLVYEVSNDEDEHPIAWECDACGAVVDCKTRFCPECGEEKEV